MRTIDLARATFAALVPAAAASAGVTTSWINPVGGSFANGANWSAGVPGTLDTALFDLDGAFPVEVVAPTSVHRVIVRRGVVDLVLPAALEATSATAIQPSIVVGDTAERSPNMVVSGTLTGRFMHVASGLFGAATVMVEPNATLDLDQVLSIGPRGDGTLTIVAGSMGCLRLVAGALDTGSGVVTVINGTLIADDAFIVGQQGAGSLTLDLGANAVTADGIVAMNPLSTGSIVVDGSGTTLDFAGTVDVGRNGVGSLDIIAGAAVTIAEDLIVGTIPVSFVFPFWPPGEGTVTVADDGSTLEVGGDLYVPLGGIGTIQAGAGGTIDVGGDLILNKPLDSAFEFTLRSVTRTPIIDVAGDVEIVDVEPSSIAIALAPGFTPSPVEPFVLIAATSVGALFDVDFDPGPGFQWSFEIGPFGGRTAVMIFIKAIPDLNGDGLVDGADLGLMLGNWGGTGLGDLNGDGVVDGGDLGLLLGAWT